MMNYPSAKRPVGATILTVLYLLYGAMGIISGIMLMIEPSGELLGFSSDIKDKMPTGDFFLVGLFLFAVYGAGSLLLCYGSATRAELLFGRISKLTGMHWSWTGGMAMIGVLVIWLSAEGLLIGLDFAATYFTMAFGLAIFATLALPQVRRFYKMG